MARRRLTHRQKGRIEDLQKRRRQQLNQLTRAASGSRSGVEDREGRVLIRHGQNLAIEDSKGRLHHCLSRQNIGEPVCGDQVVWKPTEAGYGVVVAILARSTLLSRPTFNSTDKPLAANITQLVVVLAPEPSPSQYLLDQYLVAAELLGVKVLIATNKWDLLGDRAADQFRTRFRHYEAIGYPLIHISAKNAHGLDGLSQALSNDTSILVGQSGVGKSSLVNALVPDIGAQTGRLSPASGAGRHTTSATTLYKLPEGGELIDSPGVRSFRLASVDRTGIEQGFKELSPLIGHCRYSNCQHGAEPGCALNLAVAEGNLHPDRLANFLHMVKQLSREYR